MSEVQRLVAGLHILAEYQPAMGIAPCTRVGRTLQAQEEEFGSITDEDRARLVELGWHAAGTYLWLF